MLIKNLFLSLLLFPSIALSAGVYLECDGEGNLVNISSPGNPQICLDDKDALKDLSAINDKLMESSRMITLRTPLKGMNSNKNSDRYDKAAINEIINLAIEAGVDPLATLAILILENPPLIKKEIVHNEIDKLLQYDSLYGAIPIDNIAALDVLSCKTGSPTVADLQKFDQTKINQLQVIGKKQVERRKKWFEYTKHPKVVSYLISLDRLQKQGKKEDGQLDLLKKDPAVAEFLSLNQLMENENDVQYRIMSSMSLPVSDQQLINCALNMSDDCRGVIKSQKSIPEYDLSKNAEDTRTALFCESSGQISAGGNSAFQESTSGSCCARLKVPASLESNGINKILKVRLGLEFLKKNVQKHVTKNSDVTLALQRFNGMGCFGCSEAKEALEESCMGLIDMSTRPIYGAKAADIMINMLMNNPKILSMVEYQRKNHNKRIKSFFCMANGSGKFLLDDDKYLVQQKNFLLRGAEGNYSIAFKDQAGKFQLRRPSNDQERSHYQKVETKRKRICEKYFN